MPGNAYQQVRDRAAILNFIENDTTANYEWSTFVLSQGLLGNEHKTVDDFLMSSLYTAWRAFPVSAVHQRTLENKKIKLIDYIKHYSTHGRYVSDRTFFYRKNAPILGWLRELTVGENTFLNCF